MVLPARQSLQPPLAFPEVASSDGAWGSANRRPKALPEGSFHVTSMGMGSCHLVLSFLPNLGCNLNPLKVAERHPPPVAPLFRAVFAPTLPLYPFFVSFLLSHPFPSLLSLPVSLLCPPGTPSDMVLSFRKPWRYCVPSLLSRAP